MQPEIKQRFTELRKKVLAANKAEGVTVSASVTRAFVITMLEEEFGKEAVGDIKQYEKVPLGYWTEASLHAEALKFKTIKQWREESMSSYVTAKSKGLLAKVTTHMTRLHSKGNRTKESCGADAIQCESRAEWKRRFPKTYDYALRYGWVDDLMQHETVTRKKDGHWDFEAVKEDALKYQTKKDWRAASLGAYDKAKRMGWLEQVTSHMPKRLGWNNEREDKETIP